MFKSFFKNSYSASPMAWSSVYCSPHQNPHDGKDKLAGGTATVVSDCCIPTPAATHIPTPAVAPIVAPLVTSGFANSSMVRYLEDDLQQILRTVLDSRPLALVPTFVIAVAPHYKGPYDQPLKTWFPDIYWEKTYLECYNFFQQCKEHFVTAGTIGPNRVSFVTIFLKDIALFRWQQHQHKIENQTNVLIS